MATTSFAMELLLHGNNLYCYGRHFVVIGLLPLKAFHCYGLYYYEHCFVANNGIATKYVLLQLTPIASIIARGKELGHIVVACCNSVCQQNAIFAFKLLQQKRFVVMHIAFFNNLAYSI